MDLLLFGSLAAVFVVGFFGGNIPIFLLITIVAGTGWAYDLDTFHGARGETILVMMFVVGAHYLLLLAGKFVAGKVRKVA